MQGLVSNLFIKISAQDFASGPIKRLGQQIRGTFDGVGQQVNKGVTESLTGAVFKANLLTQGFNFAIGKAQEAAQSITGAINQANQLQLEQINAATTFASLTGKSYEEAVTVIESLNNRLAKSAATLPGATQEYKNLATSIQDNVLEAFRGLDGEVDLQGFEDTVTSISESFGALTASSTKQVGNTAMGLTKALSGASVAGLRTNMFFEQNPVILNEIEKKLQELGVETLSDLDIKTRVKLIEQVGKKFITEDFKKQAGESVDGLIQGFKSVLFDPSGGIFGVMRDLDDQMKGTQSAFSAYNEVIKSLIGEEGLFGTKGPIAALGTVLGLNNMDPMKALQGAFNRINTGIQAVSDFVFNFAALIENGANLRDVVLSNLGTIRDNVAGFLGDLLGSAAEGIGRVLTGAANFMQQAPIGELLASIFNGVIEAIDEVDWRDVSTQIGRIVNGLIVQLVKFVSTLDYGALLNSALSLLSELASGLFKGLIEGVNIQLPRISISDLPSLAGELVAAIINRLTQLLANLDIASLTSKLVEFTFRIFDFLYRALTGVNWGLIMAGLPLLMLGMLTAFFSFLSAAAVNINWGQLLQAALTIINLVPALITGLFSQLIQELQARTPRLITAVEDFLVNAHASVVDAFRQLFNEVKNKVLEIIPGLGGVAQPVGSAIGSALSNIPGAAAFSRAGGQLPVAFGGLLGAIRQEQSSAPPGAKPVIANSSEFILRPDQARVFAAGAAMGGGGQTNYNFNPTINLGAGTAEAHAMDVLRYFEIWLSEHQQASLA